VAVGLASINGSTSDATAPCSWHLSRRRLSVGVRQGGGVNADVRAFQARAPAGTLVGQTEPAPGQIFELDLFPRADEEVVTRILGRGTTDEQVAAHDRAGEQSVQGRSSRREATADDTVGVVRDDVTGENEIPMRWSFGGDDAPGVEEGVVLDDERRDAVDELK